MTQLALFGTEGVQDKRPLPLIVAEKWGFNLTHVDQAGDPSDFLYSAREWYIGIGGTKNGWTQFHGDWVSRANPVKIEVKRLRRKPEMLEFVTAEGLYSIAQRMQMKDGRGALDQIKDYLSKAGVLIDDARRDPAAAAALSEALSVHHKQRLEGMVTRNELTAWLRDAFGSNFAFGQFTNAEYKGLFGRTAAQIKAETGKGNARDGMTTEGIAFVNIVESSCLRLFGGRDSVTEREAFEIVKRIAEPLGANVQLLQHTLGVDLATGKPLLTV